MVKICSFCSVALVGLLVFSTVGFAAPPASGDGSHDSRKEADITREVAPPYYFGVLELELRKVGDEIKLCPILREEKTGKTYRIRTYEYANCEEAIDDCKVGEKCVIKGIIGSEGDLFADEFTAFGEDGKEPVTETKVPLKTDSRAEFTKASEEELVAVGIEDVKRFIGEGAFKDESGMIWGDIAKKEDGSPDLMNYKEALEYCKDLGAKLPSGYPKNMNGKHNFPNRDSDFVRFHKYMGGAKYNRQILPNLNHFFWSLSVHPDYGKFAYYFNGRNDDVGDAYRNDDYFSVRCVVVGR